MGTFSIWHWLILLVVVVVVFGTSKLKNAGKDLGTAVKGFKDAVKEEDSSQSAGQVINHQQTHDASTPSTQKDKTNV